MVGRNAFVLRAADGSPEWTTTTGRTTGKERCRRKNGYIRIAWYNCYMSDIRMTRIDCDDKTWARFRAQCLELGQEVPERLGSLVRGAVVAREKRRPRWVADR